MSNVYQTKFNKFLRDGARPAKFALFGISSPFGGNAHIDNDLIVGLLKTSQFPGMSNEIIDLKFKGRSIPIKGQTKFDNTWNCSFYLEETHSLRFLFMDWITAMDQIHNFGKVSSEVMTYQQSSKYTSEIILSQVNFDDDTQQTADYKLYNVFPKNITTIELDYGELGRVLEYTVEFSYSHFDITKRDPDSGTVIDGLKNAFLNKVTGVIGALKSNVTSAIAGAIKSAASGFTSSNNSKDGSFLSGIGSKLSSAGSSFMSSASTSVNSFSPSNFMNK